MRIGVFDSGIGGLTVLRAIRRRCPGHSTSYLGDTARVPYGTKSPETVRRYAMGVVERLASEGAELIVVACNTATAYGLDAVREIGPPVLGVVEPGAAPAIAAAYPEGATDAADAPGGGIGVLGTPGTIRSGAYPAAIARLRPDARVRSIACPLFVPLVEEGWTSGPVARAVAEAYLAPWLATPGDRPRAVVLGCTHYPLLGPLLREVLGDETTLVDSAEAVAEVVARRLANEAPEAAPEHRLRLTDASETFAGIAKRFFGEGGAPMPDIELVDLEPWRG